MNRHEGGRMQAGFYTGVLDIGGTKILAGLIDPAGELVARRRIETQAARGAGDVITRLVPIPHESVERLSKDKKKEWGYQGRIERRSLAAEDVESVEVTRRHWNFRRERLVKVRNLPETER